MKKIVTTLGAVALSATAAQAGGIDRSGQSVAVLFEQGNYVEFSFGRVAPSVSGVGAGTAVSPLTPTPGQASGDMAGNYNSIGGGLKYQINDQFSAALIVDQPFGADVSYPAATTYFARGSTAKIRTMAMTALLKYTSANNLSVYGGLKYQTMSAVASVPFVAAYTGKADRDGGLGYVVGVAYEKPEIALRVAVTYSSSVKHNFTPVETTASPLVPAFLFGLPTTVKTPQSVNLEFQSGVAKDTLVFGSIRWVDWSKFKIDPAVYNALTSGSALVSYSKDTVTYSLGVGRKLNENWAVSASLGYEKAGGGFSANLGPTDGKKSLTLAAVYTKDNIKITGGVSYVKIGNAKTTLNTPSGVAAANFSGNKAVGVGIKVGYRF
ncbi:OmpP1/FadL family transporter [Pseudorhodobacter sp.]|uniref:OmpP1/FadL family transporter n=1 Tax=Pseudorhodobacter sp. TaxID=1934400 RepID=UPI002648CBD8|nr:outer membrane protein transport protein [Pseudorhodobacter sp.]MDN5786611.1 outer membrane protein transport protein [Pseudorhodobacter sp.]